ncbi:rhodanese-like domain-containing protein [Desulfarculus baarsii]
MAFDLKKLVCRALAVLALAAVAGLAFNLLMPQGVGWLPPELSEPLWRAVSLEQAAAMHKRGALFVDARDPGDFKLAQVRGAVNLYREEWDQMRGLLAGVLAKAPAVVVYGRSQSRRPDAWVAQALRQDGMNDVYVMEADFEQWREAGLPVRQRRRAAQ